MIFPYCLRSEAASRGGWLRTITVTTTSYLSRLTFTLTTRIAWKLLPPEVLQPRCSISQIGLSQSALFVMDA